MLIFLSAFLLSCGSFIDKYPDAEITETDAGNTLIVTEDFSALILTGEFMEANAPWAYLPEYWTPKINQIFEIESNLAEYLAQHGDGFNSGHAPNQDKLSTYGRQYYGETNPEGSFTHGVSEQRQMDPILPYCHQCPFLQFYLCGFRHRNIPLILSFF